MNLIDQMPLMQARLTRDYHARILRDSMPVGLEEWLDRFITNPDGYSYHNRKLIMDHLEDLGMPLDLHYQPFLAACERVAKLEREAVNHPVK